MNQGEYLYIDKVDKDLIPNYRQKSIQVCMPSLLSEVNINEFQGIAILCELDQDIGGNIVSRTDFYGISLAQKIRREGYKGKILFMSFLTRSTLTKDKLDMSIVNAIGHGFVRLPSSLKQWMKAFDSINVLDDLEWFDIDRNYCNKEGIARLELHALSGLSRRDTHDLEQTKEVVFKSVKNVFRLFGKAPKLLINSIENKIALNAFATSSDLITYTRRSCEDILFDNLGQNELSEFLEKKSWHVLYLDDEIDHNHEFVKALESKGICVEHYRDGTEALNKLRRDQSENARVVLVISDYRLEYKRDNVSIHQSLQGYSFLKRVSDEFPYLGLVALSAMPRKFLSQSFKSYGIRVNVYSKKDYLSDNRTISILADEIEEIGDETIDAQVRLPRMSSSKWELYEPFYRAHRQSQDYAPNENYISNKAKVYCSEYENGDISFDLKGYTTELKGKNKNPDDSLAFNEFLEKMVCRRVILWHSQKYGITSPEQLLSVLKGKQFSGTEGANTAKNQINTNLALRLLEFPWNTTIEEKNWLIYSMSLDHELVEQTEQLELEILIKTEKRLLDGLSRSLLPFPPNTYSRAKRWLSKGFIDLTQNTTKQENFKRIIALLKQEVEEALAEKQKGVSKSPMIKSSKDFAGFLGRILETLKKLDLAKKSTPFEGDIKKVQEKVLSVAKKEFKNQEWLLDALESLAYIFFHELDTESKSYKGVDGYNKAFIEYCKKEGEYLNPFRLSIDSEHFSF